MYLIVPNAAVGAASVALAVLPLTAGIFAPSVTAVSVNSNSSAAPQLLKLFVAESVISPSASYAFAKASPANVVCPSYVTARVPFPLSATSTLTTFTCPS